MTKKNHQTLIGKWKSGIALDVQTESSVFTGHDQFGHATFDTTRTELGELLFRFKYRQDQSALPELVNAAAGFLSIHRAKLDVLVPVPPSKMRTVQPVLVMAEAIGAKLELPVINCIQAPAERQELKSIENPVQREAALTDIFSVDPSIVGGKNILLFDDLYRSGATLNAITEVLLNSGGAASVRVLTITRTRSNQ